ncbi:MAG: hypothetical protein WC004_00295 [Candidatus Absconditabacterales bacterium]
MTRRKTMTLPNGEKVFERQQPLEGLQLIEELTRPLEKTLTATVDGLAATLNLQIKPGKPGQIDPRAIITE